MDGETQQSLYPQGNSKTLFFVIALLIILAGISYAVWIKISNTRTQTPRFELPGAVKLDFSPYGPLLTTTSGHSLYYFLKDAPGTTTCYESCATKWLPYMATDGLRVDAAAGEKGLITGTLSIIDRADGAKQLTYAGWPLYQWKEDVAPGQANGHGINKLWAIARPNGAFDLATTTTIVRETMVNPKPVVFNITGNMYDFSIKKIKVKKGDLVTINFESTEGAHDWVIDEPGARTEIVTPGKKTSVTFIADKVGTFEYYCSVGDHRQKGMKGKFIVE